jgi:hypothetical protein
MDLGEILDFWNGVELWEEVLGASFPGGSQAICRFS